MTPALRSLQITDWQRESETYLPPTTNYYSDFQWNNWMAFCQNAFWKCSPDSYLCITTWLHKKLTSESCAAPESKNKVPSEQMQQMQSRPNATLPQSSLCKGTKQTFVYFHPLWKFFIIIMFIIETFCFCQNVKESVSPSYKLSIELLYFHPCYLFSEEWCVIMITWVF